MEILVVYSSTAHDYLHEERFDGRDELEEARSFARREHGVLFVKIAGKHMEVESYLRGSAQKIAERVALRRLGGARR